MDLKNYLCSYITINTLHGFSCLCQCYAVLAAPAKSLQSCPTLCDPIESSPPGSTVHRDSPGKNTGVGCHALLQGIFPTQGSNPGLPHCSQILNHLRHRERQRKWAPKNWCFWVVVLQKTLESPFCRKEIKPVSLKGNQPWIHWKDWCWCWSSTTLTTWWEEPTHWKRPWC